jgi:hypothetical protein
VNAAGAERDTYAGVTEIPPVIYCARCGLPSCDGCAPPAELTVRRPVHHLRWAVDGPSFGRLFDGAVQSSTDAEAVFGRLRGAARARAVGFALAVELLALGSIALTSLLALLLVMPRSTAVMLRVPTTWIVSGTLWLLASVLVVLLHVSWARLLERGLVRAGARPAPELALEFACYSCGWDLLTSPLGIWLSWRHGSARGEGRATAVLAALRAPRPAMLAYLEGCRGLERAAAASVIRRAGKDALLIVGLAGLLAIGIILGFLAATWPH